jgi:hypothetical protein
MSGFYPEKAAMKLINTGSGTALYAAALCSLSQGESLGWGRIGSTAAVRVRVYQGNRGSVPTTRGTHAGFTIPRRSATYVSVLYIDVI